MNRMEEYKALLNQVNEAPPSLEHTLTRAIGKFNKQKRIRRFFAIPASSLLLTFAAFVVLVNVSVSFAYACQRLPFLRELAAAVAFSPSLSSAVENEYIQQIGLEQSDNGITMRIEYVIVDQKNLEIFYSLDSDAEDSDADSETYLSAHHSIRALSGEPQLDGYYIFSRGLESADELHYVSIGFDSNDMPSQLILDSKVQVHEVESMTGPAAPAQDALDRLGSSPSEADPRTNPEYAAAFSFSLAFDPTFTEQGEAYEVNRTVATTDGQQLTFTTFEIYPTHMRINMQDHQGNTAWLKSMTYYLEDDKGNRFEGIRNGITSSGSPDSPMMVSHRLESPYFAGSGTLALYITEVVWLDKSMEQVKVDLAAQSADVLPEGVSLKEATRIGNNWGLTFEAELRDEKIAFYQLFSYDYYDESGNQLYYNSASSSMISDPDQNRFQVDFALVDYPYDTVYLSPSFSHIEKLETPIIIEVKQHQQH